MDINNQYTFTGFYTDEQDAEQFASSLRQLPGKILGIDFQSCKKIVIKMANLTEEQRKQVEELMQKCNLLVAD